MLKDIKHTLRQSAIYGLSRLSAKLAGFILLPFISLKLDVSNYGYFVLTESLWQILWAIFLFGLESGTVRWYTLIKDEINKKKFLFSVFIFLVVFNILCLGLIYLFRFPFSLLLYGNIIYTDLLICAALIAFMETLLFIVFLVIRIEEKAKLYTFFALLITVLSLILQIFALYSSENKLLGIFIAKILAPFIGLILLMPYTIRKISIGFDFDSLKELLKYSYPIMLASLLSTLLNQQDRYILSKFTDSSSVGIYGLAFNITGIINFLLISPYSLAFTVISWKKLKDENAKRFFTKNITYVFFIVIYASMAVSLFTPHLIKVFTLRTDYWASSEYVPWLIISMPFYAIQIIGTFSFYVTKNTKYILISYLNAVIMNFCLNLLIIPKLGIYGACISNFVSFVALTLSTYIFSRKNYFFNYEWMKMISMIMVYIILVSPFFIFSFENRLMVIILKFIPLALFPVILYLIGFYEPVEIKAIKGFINKYITKKEFLK